MDREPDSSEQKGMQLARLPRLPPADSTRVRGKYSEPDEDDDKLLEMRRRCRK